MPPRVPLCKIKQDSKIKLNLPGEAPYPRVPGILCHLLEVEKCLDLLKLCDTGIRPPMEGVPSSQKPRGLLLCRPVTTGPDAS